MHEHSQGPGTLEQAHLPQLANRLRLALAFTGVILVGEVVGGYVSNSMALLSDAGHVFTDLVAILLVWFTLKQASRPPTPQMTYGYHRWSILATVVNALSLGGISLAIFYGAFRRWQHPQPIDSPLMLTVAVLGLGVNLGVVLYLHSGARENLPVRSAFWHALGDALSSVGVIIGGVIIYFTSWVRVDALLSFLIGIIVLTGAWRLLAEGVSVLLEAPPKELNPREVTAAVAGVAGVRGVHDLHLWSIAPGFSVLSCHISLDDLPLSEGTRIMGQVHHLLQEKYHIAHSTLQLECPGCQLDCCPLTPDTQAVDSCGH